MWEMETGFDQHGVAGSKPGASQALQVRQRRLVPRIARVAERNQGRRVDQNQRRRLRSLRRMASRASVLSYTL